MTQTIRYPEILEIARRDGKVTVEHLSEHFGVTLQTIRRDLADLAEAGRLERVHGGAVLPSGTVNIGYEERRRLNARGKIAMARACAAQIPEDCAVFLNIGTSTEAVAAELMHHRNLLVVTNNMNVAIFGDLAVQVRYRRHRVQRDRHRRRYPGLRRAGGRGQSGNPEPFASQDAGRRPQQVSAHCPGAHRVAG